MFLVSELLGMKDFCECVAARSKNDKSKACCEKTGNRAKNDKDLKASFLPQKLPAKSWNSFFVEKLRNIT